MTGARPGRACSGSCRRSASSGHMASYRPARALSGAPARKCRAAFCKECRAPATPVLTRSAGYRCLPHQAAKSAPGGERADAPQDGTYGCPAANPAAGCECKDASRPSGTRQARAFRRRRSRLRDARVAARHASPVTRARPDGLRTVPETGPVARPSRIAGDRDGRCRRSRRRSRIAVGKQMLASHQRCAGPARNDHIRGRFPAHPQSRTGTETLQTAWPCQIRVSGTSIAKSSVVPSRVSGLPMAVDRSALSRASRGRTSNISDGPELGRRGHRRPRITGNLPVDSWALFFYRVLPDHRGVDPP